MEKVWAVYDRRGKLLCACTHSSLAKSLASYCGMPASEVRGIHDARTLWATMKRHGLTIRSGTLQTHEPPQ